MAVSRKTRYAAAVSTLLALVFLGVVVVVGAFSATTFRPLPFSRPETLVQLTAGGNLWEADTLAQTLRLAPQVERFATFQPSTPAAVAHAGLNVEATSTVTSSNFFDLLGLRVGRANLAVYHDQPGVAIISHRLAARLHIPTDALGATIELGDRAMTVVGFIDPIDAFPAGTDLWYADAHAQGPVWLAIVRTRAPVDVDAFNERLTFAVRTVTGDVRQNVTALPIGAAARPSMPGDQRALSAGIVLFAVIALLNYGLLGIGEARRREQEFAIRVALGASRARVSWEFFLTQLRLMAIAGVVAVLLLQVARIALPNTELAPPLSRLPGEIWITLGVFVAALLAVAALPGRIASRTEEMEVLRRVSARGSRFEQLWNRAFVGTQFAVTAFLLVTGGAAALTLQRLQLTTYGFETDHMIIAKASFKSPSLQSDEGARGAVADVQRQVAAAFPGSSAVFTLASRTMEGGPFRYATDPPTPQASLTSSSGPPWLSEDVSPAFFDLMGIRIVAGRGFRDRDDRSSEPVVILSEEGATRFGGTQQALGKRLRFGEDDGEWRTIVGVAANAHPIDAISFLRQAMNTKRRWMLNFAYRPLAQTFPHGGFRMKDGRAVGATPGVSVLVRTNRPDAARALTMALTRAAPGETFRRLEPLGLFLDGAHEVDRSRATTQLLIQFSVAGFLLALVGAMVLIDDVVRSRTSEIGIRRALGAQSPSLVLLASRETFIAGAIGVLAGVGVGMRLGPVVAGWMKGSTRERFLPHVELSAPVLIGVAVLLLLLIAGGTALRALRAARLDPMVALRTL
jgi:putative ABC transport system permease protein